MNLRFLALPCRRHLGLYWLYNRSLKIHVISGRKKWEWSVANSPRSKRAWGRGKSSRLPPILSGFRSWVMVAYEQAPAGGGGGGGRSSEEKGIDARCPSPFPFPVFFLFTLYPGKGEEEGATLYSGQYKERSTFFTRDSDIWKGRDCISWSVWKVGEIYIAVCERTSTKLKGLQTNRAHKTWELPCVFKWRRIYSSLEVVQRSNEFCCGCCWLKL